MKNFKYTPHSQNRVIERGLDFDLINYYRKNELLVKCFSIENENHYVAYIYEKQDYYIFVINNKTNSMITCMRLKYASRAGAYSKDCMLEAYNLSVNPIN